MPDIRVAVAMPMHERKVDFEALSALQREYATDDRIFSQPWLYTSVVQQGSPILSRTFNDLLCEALNHPAKCTHFVMLHSDVIPERGWVSKLLAILHEKEADVITVVTPIKDHRGKTGVAIGYPDCAGPMKTLSMREIHKLPETFNAADVGYPDLPLLTGTCCWIADLRHPFWTDVDEHGIAKFSFEVFSRRRRSSDGTWKGEYGGEDYLMGYAFHAAGIRRYVTRAVKADHIGDHKFTNRVPWGTLGSDRPDLPQIA
ncbi:MAG TPA: hypothetical protein VGJ15_06255 [Pirellulales bacterium]